MVLVRNSKGREIRTFYKADGRSDTPFEDAIKFNRKPDSGF